MVTLDYFNPHLMFLAYVYNFIKKNNIIYIYIKKTDSTTMVGVLNHQQVKLSRKT